MVLDLHKIFKHKQWGCFVVVQSVHSLWYYLPLSTVINCRPCSISSANNQSQAPTDQQPYPYVIMGALEPNTPSLSAPLPTIEIRAHGFKEEVCGQFAFPPYICDSLIVLFLLTMSIGIGRYRSRSGWLRSSYGRNNCAHNGATARFFNSSRDISW